MNAHAEVGFITTYPGMMRFRKSMSKVHPVSVNKLMTMTIMPAKTGAEILPNNKFTLIGWEKFGSGSKCVFIN